MEDDSLWIVSALRSIFLSFGEILKLTPKPQGSVLALLETRSTDALLVPGAQQMLDVWMGTQGRQAPTVWGSNL